MRCPGVYQANLIFPDGFIVVWPIKIKTEAHIIGPYSGAFTMLILSSNNSGLCNALGL